MRVTLKEIADRTGLSTMTVSRALRNLSSVSPDTAERVHAAARELGYTPDPALQALVSHRDQKKGPMKNPPTIAVMGLESASSPVAQKIHTRTINGAKQEAHRLGYHVDSLQLGTLPSEQERTRDILLARGIQGILLPPGRISQHLHIDTGPFSCVLMNHGMKGTPFHTVCSDHYRMTMQAIRHLLDRGSRRMVFLGGSPSEKGSDFRAMAAYSMAHYHFPEFPFQTHLLEIGDPNLIRDCIRIKPDAVLTVSGGPYYQKLIQNGFVPGKTIRFVGIDMHDPMPGVASIRVESSRIGQIAFDFLHRMLLKHERGIPEMQQRVEVEGTLMNPSALDLQTG